MEETADVPMTPTRDKLSSSKRKAAAIGELAAAIEEDMDRWQTERDAWARERAELQSSLSDVQSEISQLRENYRLLNLEVEANESSKGKEEHDFAALHRENVRLVAQTQELESRNLRERRNNEILSERNRKIQRAIMRELESDDGTSIKVCPICREELGQWSQATNSKERTPTAEPHDERTADQRHNQEEGDDRAARSGMPEDRPSHRDTATGATKTDSSKGMCHVEIKKEVTEFCTDGDHAELGKNLERVHTSDRERQEVGGSSNNADITEAINQSTVLRARASSDPCHGGTHSGPPTPDARAVTREAETPEATPPHESADTGISRARARNGGESGAKTSSTQRSARRRSPPKRSLSATRSPESAGGSAQPRQLHLSPPEFSLELRKKRKRSYGATGATLLKELPTSVKKIGGRAGRSAPAQPDSVIRGSGRCQQQAKGSPSRRPMSRHGASEGLSSRMLGWDGFDAVLSTSASMASLGRAREEQCQTTTGGKKRWVASSKQKGSQAQTSRPRHDAGSRLVKVPADGISPGKGSRARRACAPTDRAETAGQEEKTMLDQGPSSGVTYLPLNMAPVRSPKKRQSTIQSPGVVPPPSPGTTAQSMSLSGASGRSARASDNCVVAPGDETPPPMSTSEAVDEQHGRKQRWLVQSACGGSDAKRQANVNKPAQSLGSHPLELSQRRKSVTNSCSEVGGVDRGHAPVDLGTANISDVRWTVSIESDGGRKRRDRGPATGSPTKHTSSRQKRRQFGNDIRRDDKNARHKTDGFLTPAPPRTSPHYRRDSGDAEIRAGGSGGAAIKQRSPERSPRTSVDENPREGPAASHEQQAGSMATEKRSAPKHHKYQEVVRDRAKRAAMKGHDCEHCAAYLAAVGGSTQERQAILDMCSRHKHTEANGRPAETPEGFWDLSFADSVHAREDPKLCDQRREQEARKDRVAGARRQWQDEGSDLDF